MSSVHIYSPVIPLLPHQKELWSVSTRDDFKGRFKKWYRGAGKDVDDLVLTIDWMLKRKAPYWYIFPEATQGCKALWNNMFEDGRRYLDLFPAPMVKAMRSNDMTVEFWNGSMFQIVGASNIHALRGARPFGVVISEYAYVSPLLLPKIILPMLAKNGGWVSCNTTPIGHNHAYETRLAFEKMGPGWYTSVKTIEDTGLISKDYVEQQVAAGLISRTDANAEYYCKEEGSVKGAYFAESMQRAGRGNFPYDPNYLVYTLWDLAAGHDSEVICFFQFVDRRFRFIDYYEGTGMATPHYAGIIKERGYNYGIHFLPHDGAHRKDDNSSEFSTTTREKLAKLDIRNVEVLPRTASVDMDIDRLRPMLALCDFDAAKCEYLIRALEEFHADWNDAINLPRDTPKHDWASHAASAMRALPAAAEYVKAGRGAASGAERSKGYGEDMSWWSGSHNEESSSIVPSDLSGILK